MAAGDRRRRRRDPLALDPSVDTAEGAGIIGAGLSIWLLNVLFRIGVKGDEERDAEWRRASTSTHGHWPDQAPK